MRVLACKIWPLFKKFLVKKYPFLRWNQEIFNSLKHAFFSKSRKKVKTFQRTPIFKKTRKMFKSWFFTIFINIDKFIIQRQFVCLNYFKNTLSNIIVYCTIPDSLKIIDSWQISRKLKIRCQNIPLLGGFTKFQVKTPPYHDFAKLALKYAYFREIWNTH